MQEREFNLIDEVWIKLLTTDGTIVERTLPEAIINAHRYRALSGELPTQDAVLLRLMLAVVYTVFSRVDENGDKAEFDNERCAKERWKALWLNGKFPEAPLKRYFDDWHERFWLFDMDRPFYQVPQAAAGTEYATAKLNGELSESSNKIRLFSSRSGKEKNEMTYAEAARWLLYVNAFDDTSAKPKGKNLPSPGAGWLGKLGLIYAEGDNLFETLMLNLTFLRDGNRMWDEDALPVWERESVKSAERTEISVPRNPAELLTLQSRRLLLQRENGKVVGYSLLGGDFFQRSGAFAEQMTVWSTGKKNEREAAEYFPRRHDPSRQFWREFGNVFADTENIRRPGIVTWQNVITKLLKTDGGRMSRFAIVSVQYGDKDFFINDAFSDSLTLHTSLLSDMGRQWQGRITDEIGRCEKLASAVSHLEENLQTAAGEDKNTRARKNAVAEAKARFFDKADRPFRQWLAEIDPEAEDEDADAIVERWRKQAKKIALDLGEEIVNEAGEAAFIGRTVEVEDKEKKGKNREKRKLHYSSPEAYNLFIARVNGIYK